VKSLNDPAFAIEKSTVQYKCGQKMDVLLSFTSFSKEIKNRGHAFQFDKSLRVKQKGGIFNLPAERIFQA